MTLYKTIVRSALITMILAAMCTSTAFAAASGTLTADQVNIRSAADSSASVLGTGEKGSELILLGKTDGWFQVSFDGNENAYVSEEFFKISRAEGTVKGSKVNVRTAPNTSSEVLKKLNDGDVITVIAQSSDWYQLAFNDGNAYISKDYLSGSMLQYLPAFAAPAPAAPVQAPQEKEAAAETTVNTTTDVTAPVGEQEEPVQAASAQAYQGVPVSNTYGISTASSKLRIRSIPSTSGTIMGSLFSGDVFDVIENGGEWLKIKTEDGKEGYVSAEFVSLRTGEKPSRSNASSKGEQIVAYAKQFLGTPYVWAGTDLNKGVDCSGYVYAVMKHFGISVNRSSSTMVSNGIAVSKAELAMGDLVFFATDGTGNISHVGIYIGNNQYIHSSDGKANGVTISNMNDAYSKNTYVTARRVVR